MIRAADLFCGAGGSSTGLVQAVAAAGARLDLTAVNHWPVAVETHAANHPEARHLCESLDGVDPRKVIGGKLDILTASPECIHHSNARGGKPMDDQSRATAWHVLRWTEALRPSWVLVENVREFTTWGPLGSTGRPLVSKRGELFRLFVEGFQRMGYRVEWRVLNAADYGAATTRQRFFLVARLGRSPIPWPEQTHAPAGQPGLFAVKPWRAAREVIDWSLRGRSIFEGKPLAAKTLARIAAGARRFWGVDLEPFLVQLSHGGRALDLNRPLPTITASPKGGDLMLAQPFLSAYYGAKFDGDARAYSVDGPIPTIPTENRFAVIEPFLLQQQSGGVPRVVSSPVPTVATKGAISLIEPFLVKYFATATGAQSIHDPLDTITTRDRHALVSGEAGDARLDVRIRMLQPHELAAGQGFPAGYTFAGNKTEQTRQIGNAVEVHQARALFAAMLATRHAVA